jgi:hypothetical protein
MEISGEAERKGQSSLAPPQHGLTPEREPRFGLKPGTIFQLSMPFSAALFFCDVFREPEMVVQTA